jgi:hypothetical protein
VYQLTDRGPGGGIPATPLTIAVRLGGDVTCGAVAAQELLDKGKAYANAVSHRLLRAKPALTGRQDLLLSINRSASHAR